MTLTGAERGQLEAIRSAAVQIASAADAVLRAPAAADGAGACPPHQGEQKDLSTMGGPRRFYCPACGTTYEPDKEG